MSNPYHNVDKLPSYLHQESLEVYRHKGTTPTLSNSDLEFLIAKAKKSDKKRARICFHSSDQEPIHEMAIALCNGTNLPPHRHKSKYESFTVLEGEATLILFDQDGKVSSQVLLGACQQRFARIPPMTYHTLEVTSEVFVLIETTQGPFLTNDSENAPFANNLINSDDENGKAAQQSNATSGGL